MKEWVQNIVVLGALVLGGVVILLAMSWPVIKFIAVCKWIWG